MKDNKNFVLIILAFVLSSFALGGALLNLSENQQFLVLIVLVLSLSLLAVGKNISGFQGLRGAKGRKLAFVGIVLGIVDVGLPYFFLKNTVKFWANYLFWVFLASIVLILGIWRINKWGEKT